MTLYPAQRHRIQYRNGSTLAVLDGAQCIRAMCGVGQQLGSCSISQKYGRVKEPGGDFADIAPPTTLRSKIVGIQVWDDTRDDWVDIWSGVITGEERFDRGARMGEVVSHGLGIGYLLKRCHCVNGFELNGSGGVTDRVGEPLVFNEIAGGDCSATTHVVNGRSIHVHDRTVSTNAKKWTARAAIDNILATQAGYYSMADGSWIQSTGWAISDPTGCLAYEIPKTDISGLDALDAIAKICPISRGITWRLDYDYFSDAVLIVCSSTVPSPIGDGTYTLPAAVTQTILDTTAINYTDVLLTWEEEGSADIVDVIGNNPRMVLTLNYKPKDLTHSAMDRGWSDGDVSDYIANKPNADKAFTRYIVRKEWTGTQYAGGYGDNGITSRLVTSGTGDPLYGDGGFTGERVYDLGSSADRCYMPRLEFARDLPCGEGFTDDKTGPRQLPVILITDGSVWRDVSNTQRGSQAWQITMEKNPAGMRIGSSRATQDMTRILLQGAQPEVLATVGVIDPLPLRVSWRRPQAQWPRPDPRIVTVHMPQCDLWTLPDGAVTGLDEARNLIRYGNGTKSIRDDRQQMRDALAMMRGFCERPVRTLSCGQRGIIDHSDATRPGVLITAVVFASGTEIVNAYIDSRAYVFSETGVQTLYTAKPQPPNMETIR